MKNKIIYWLLRLQILYWIRPICRMFHRQHHKMYWFEYSKNFHKCNKCGHHFATPRDLVQPDAQRMVNRAA